MDERLIRIAACRFVWSKPLLLTTNQRGPHLATMTTIDHEKAAYGADDKLEEDLQRVGPAQSLKLDSSGLPLVPQPSDDPRDPLNYSMRTKIGILILVSLVAMNTPWNLAVGNPAFVLIGRAFGKEPVEGGCTMPAVLGIR
jgi:hypothetical protein